MAARDLRRKLTILADAARFDASCSSSGLRRHPSGPDSTEGLGICHSYTSDGRCVSLLKILLTNHCVYDCQYCVNRVSSDVPRARFSIGEVVWLTMEFWQRNFVEGLFLSSGIIENPDVTMEQLVEVARALRQDHGFRGYIHLKTAAGCSPELIDKAGLYADRLSVNIELPTEADLQRLAPDKDHARIEHTMARIQHSSTENPAFAPSGQTTQMVVGATESTDAAILLTSKHLYDTHQLQRVYYSAYQPVDGAEQLPAEAPPLVREQRLYQADWLLRFYGFTVEDLAPPERPNLDLHVDPKLAWALANRGFFPIDVNVAPRELLLRIPGIGVRNVDRIITARRFRKLSLDDLARLRITMRRARPFVVTADHHPAAHLLDGAGLEEQQLGLFDDTVAARTGEL